MESKRWFYAIALAAVVWTACDDDDNDSDRNDFNDADETFVERAGMSNMAEIEMGELALTRGTDSLVVAFAESMVNDHTTAQDELANIADNDDDVDWPSNLDQEHQGIWETLSQLEGHRFDSAYIASQVTAHEKAVQLFQNGRDNGRNEDVRNYINKYLPKIEMHLEKADSIETVLPARQQQDQDQAETVDPTNS